jgi:hypothetical protein
MVERRRRQPCLPNRRTAKPYYGPIHHHDYSTCVITFTQCWYDDFCLTLQEISPCKIQRLLCLYSGSLNVPFPLFLVYKRCDFHKVYRAIKKSCLLLNSTNNVHRLPDWKILEKRNCSILWSKYLKNINVQCTIFAFQNINENQYRNCHVQNCMKKSHRQQTDLSNTFVNGSTSDVRICRSKVKWF